MQWDTADVKKFTADIVEDMAHIDAIRRKAPVTETTLSEYAKKTIREAGSPDITLDKATYEYDKLHAKLKAAELLGGKPFIEAVFAEISRHALASKLNLEEKFAIAADGVGGYYA